MAKLCSLLLVSLALLATAGAARATVHLNDAQARAHLEEMEGKGVLRDPFWAQAYWVRAINAPSVAARASDLEWALQFDPDFTRARWHLTTTLARQGDPAFLSQALTCLTRGAFSFPFQGRLLYLLFTVGGGALAGAFVLLAMISIGAAIPRIRHGIWERFQFLPSEIRAGATVLTLAFPIVLALTLPPIAVLFWLLLLGTAGVWSVLERWGRRICAAALVTILLAPLGLTAWMRITELTFPDSYLRTLWASQAWERADPLGALRLAPPLQAAQDPDHFATLALLDRRAGRYRKAAHWLEQAIAKEPGQWSYHNNLGNLRLLEGNAEAALEAYANAVALAPREPTVYLNQAQAWVAKLEFKNADDAIQKAVGLGSRLTQTLGADADEVIVQDRVLNSAELWLRFAQGNAFRPHLSWREALTMTLAPILPMNPFWMSIPLFLALYYVLQTSRLPRTQTCAGCGGFICRKCHYRVHRKSYCAGCYAIRQEIRAPLKRDEMLQERRRRTARGSWATGLALSIVLPGTGLWVTGSPRRAAFYVSIVLGVVVFAISGIIWPNPNPVLGDESAFGTLTVAAGLFALMALLSARSYVKTARRRVDPEPAAPAVSRSK